MEDKTLESNNYFRINVNKYCSGKDFYVYRPASINAPLDNSVMFLMGKRKEAVDIFYLVKNCLIFWQRELFVPEEIENKNAIIRVDEPRLEYCRFFKENSITNLPTKETFIFIDGAYICDNAVISKNVTIMPGAYIGGQVRIGDNSYIGCGAKIVGNVKIGKNVVIRENTVIGANGLSTDRDIKGHAVTMPQFGGVIIEDNVEIGSNSVIARGAIDNTIIGRGSKIDNSCFISHNVQLGADTFIVGETIMFGSSKTGDRAFISGNSTIRNKVAIGNDAFVGMGAVVTKNVVSGTIVIGNPAKEKGGNT